MGFNGNASTRKRVMLKLVCLGEIAPHRNPSQKQWICHIYGALRQQTPNTTTKPKPKAPPRKPNMMHHHKIIVQWDLLETLSPIDMKWWWHKGNLRSGVNWHNSDLRVLFFFLKSGFDFFPSLSSCCISFETYIFWLILVV